MTKREYANKVAELVNGVVKEVEKANGVFLTGIIQKGEDFSASVYIDTLYDNFVPVEKAAEQVREVWATAMPEEYREISKWIKDWSQAKLRLEARLYNAKTSADIYKSAKGYGFPDLIIVPYVAVGRDGYIKVTRELAKAWGVTDKTILDKAMENAKAKQYELTGLNDVVSKIMGIPLPPMEEFAYLLRNDNGVCGAIGAIIMKKELKKRWPEGYVVIPSSIHETLIMPGRPDGNLQGLVRAVNTKAVMADEVLSDRVYEF